MGGFRLGVRLRPLNKSGQRLHPQGAFESVGGQAQNDSAAGPRRPSGPGEGEHITGLSPAGPRRRSPGGSAQKTLNRLLDI